MCYEKKFTIRINLFWVLAFVVSAVLLLSGCSTTSPVKQDTKYVVVEPTADMLQKCEIARPPSKNEYLSSTKDNREKSLSEYATKLLNNLNQCNQRWDSLSKWFEEQSSLYSRK